MIPIEYYKKALLIRRTEDKFLELFSQGRMNGTVHTCNGQEFSGISFCKSLNKGDFIYSNHRCHGHYLAFTEDVAGLIAELMGKESGICGGIGSSQHLCNKNFYSNGVQGGIVPVAAGMAMIKKIQKKNKIGVVFIGDGTLGEGVVYETFNLCSLLKIPLLIVCENNGYSQSTAQKDFLAGDILSRAEAFGIKTYHSNTWDLEELFSEAENSINYVRKNCKTAFHLVDTYRLNPHSKHDDNRNQNELDLYKKKDPLNLFMKHNVSEYKDMLFSVNNLIDQIVIKLEKEKELSLKHYSIDNVPPTINKYISLEEVNEKVISRINLFFHETIAKDKSVIFIGEDVLSPYGGAFKAAEKLSEKFPDNVITTPLSEHSITGLSNGMALAGYKPYLEIMFGDFITLCMDQIINHASKFHHMYNKKMKCPVVIRTPMGGGRGYGPTHSQTLDKFLAGIDNVKIVALNSFFDPKLIYEEIYNNENHPIIVIENKIDYGRIVGDKKLSNYTLERSIKDYPIVRCTPKNEVPNLTIVSYGGISSDVFENLINIFNETEFLPELIILSKISPLDIQPILNSVEKTRNVIVIEEGSIPFGIGSEILSLIAENTEIAKMNIMFRIGSVSLPIPSARSLEEYALPNKNILEKIVQRINE
jgi:2-oxoisovalerate dehydrogenase E1 component